MPASRPAPARQCALLLAAAAFAAVALGLASGSVAIPPGRLLTLLVTPDGGVESTILWELRLPRVLAAFAVGGALALAGALVQVLLRNPLGDPYVLGVSGGASAAVLGALLLGLPVLAHPAAAFVGALASTALVFALGRRDGVLAVDRLLLTGIVVATGWAAIVSFTLSVSAVEQLRPMLFFLMGDLSDVATPWPPVLALAAGLAATLPFARDLNLLALGDLRAASLGVATAPLHLLVYVVSSLLTAAAVSAAGGIGFVGLVAPHLARLVGGSDHRWVLPGAVLLGGTLLTLADTLARVLIAPRQLPVGVVTALLGVPGFLALLHGRR